MVRNKVYLAGREYASMTAAKAHAKTILGKYDSGDCVNEEDATFLKAAIALRGPEKFMEKVGLGIESIFLRYNESGDMAFYIKRIDGSETDFSYIKCFAKSSIFSDFSSACRNAIKEDKAAFKTGLGYDQYHVHHDGLDFKTIVQAFIEERRLDITTVTYLQGDGVEGRYFVDETLVIAFKAFHSRLASLEVLEKNDHKARHKKQI